MTDDEDKVREALKLLGWTVGDGFPTKRFSLHCSPSCEEESLYEHECYAPSRKAVDEAETEEDWKNAGTIGEECERVFNEWIMERRKAQRA